MKYYIVILFFVLFACNKSSEQANKLIGKWKLIEIYNDPGDGNGVWLKASDENTYTYQFNNDNTFSKDGSNNDCDGVYLIDYRLEQYYILTLTCHKNLEITSIFYFNNGYLIIDGAPNNCDESCAEKFVRVE